MQLHAEASLFSLFKVILVEQGGKIIRLIISVGFQVGKSISGEKQDEGVAASMWLTRLSPSRLK